MYRRVKKCLLVLLLAVCAVEASQASEPPTKTASIHSIGIISSVGQTITLKNIGLMVFSNSEDKIDASSWGIDEKVVGIIKDSLSQQYDLKAVQTDKNAFSTQATKWYALSEVPVEDVIKALPKDNGVDAYLVVYPAPFQDPFFGTNQFLRGLGICRHGGGFQNGIVAYALYRVALVDARTDKIIASAAGSTGEPTLFNPKFPSMPEGVWSEQANTFTDNQKSAINMDMTTLLKTSLPWALRELGFEPNSPPAPAQ